MPVWRVTTSCIVMGQVCQNVIHLARDASDRTDFQVATTVNLEWIPHIRNFQHTGARWFQIEARNVVPGGNAPTVITIDLAGTGPAVSDADDPCRGRVLQFRTIMAGKQGRGRYFIPGTSWQAFSANQVKAASITAGNPLVQQLKDRFLAPDATSDYVLVIAPRSQPSNYKTVVDIVQRSIVGYQRRRNIGVGI